MSTIFRVMLAVVPPVLCACAGSDSKVPWDTAEMTRELSRDLRQYEHVTLTSAGG